MKDDFSVSRVLNTSFTLFFRNFPVLMAIGFMAWLSETWNRVPAPVRGE